MDRKQKKYTNGLPNLRAGVKITKWKMEMKTPKTKNGGKTIKAQNSLENLKNGPETRQNEKWAEKETNLKIGAVKIVSYSPKKVIIGKENVRNTSW